jgi:hypothetical protein
MTKITPLLWHLQTAGDISADDAGDGQLATLGAHYAVNLYPRPGTVTIMVGCLGSLSSFWRRLPT